jgi:hypothetical protein
LRRAILPAWARVGACVCMVWRCVCVCCVCVYVYGCDIVDRWRGGCGTDEWGDRVTGRWIDNDAGVCARGASTHARVPSCAGTFARVHACADALCGRQAPARTPAVLVLPVRLFAGQHEDLPALGRFPPGASVPLRAPAAVVPAGSRRVRAPLPARAASPTHTAGRGAWVVGRRRRRVRPSAACAARGSARRRRHGAGDPGHGQFVLSVSDGERGASRPAAPRGRAGGGRGVPPGLATAARALVLARLRLERTAGGIQRVRGQPAAGHSGPAPE